RAAARAALATRPPAPTRLERSPAATAGPLREAARRTRWSFAASERDGDTERDVQLARQPEARLAGDGVAHVGAQREVLDHVHANAEASVTAWAPCARVQELRERRAEHEEQLGVHDRAVHGGELAIEWLPYGVRAAIEIDRLDLRRLHLE